MPTLSVCLLITSSPAFAISDFRDAWRVRYPQSNSDDIDNTEANGGDGCQLCHQSLTGSQPWNQYGWDIRNEYRTNGFDINQAFETVENTDHDGDPLGINSLDEIVWNFQPGWRAGSVNSVFMANGMEIPNQAPPATTAFTALDFPAAVVDPIPAAIPTGAIALELNEVAGSFNAPLRAVRAPGIDGSLFVVEQVGKIQRVNLGSGEKTLFHDVSASLVSLNPSYDERGLLGLAFHPNFASNGLFYTYQSEPVRASQDSQVDFSTVVPQFSPNHRSMVVEYRASNASCNSPISKIQNLLIIDQPQSNHNGGDLAFDDNGYLMISLGDGGGANDQGPGHDLQGTGRDNTNVLGSILRIDPLGNNSANTRYGIPPDNPFIAMGDAGVDEIFAYGFRNPFRLSIDSANGDLYTSDVGQNQIEEVDQVSIGGNYGWNWQEGSFNFYNPLSGAYVSNIDPPGLPMDLLGPIGEYDHDEGRSVTGGYVYRGAEIPAAVGSYVFADFSGPDLFSPSGLLFKLDLMSQQIEKFFLASPVVGYITGFGQDASKELYVLLNDQINTTGVDGKLMRLSSSGTAPSFPNSDGESAICPPVKEMCVPIRASNGNIALVCL